MKAKKRDKNCRNPDRWRSVIVSNDIKLCLLAVHCNTYDCIVYVFIKC